MGAPGRLSLIVRIGDTEQVVAAVQDDDGAAVPIAGRTYAAQIRRTPESSTIIASFTCAITDAPNGVVTCTLPAATTGTLTPGVAVWDMQETNGSVVTTLLAGFVTITQDVTR
jgi:hypothetical protein